MGKRGRPPKQAESITVKKRGRPPKSTSSNHAMQNLRVSARSETVFPQSGKPEVRARESASSNGLPNPWAAAFKLSQTVPSDYAMTPSEQELAFNVALAIKKGAVMVELGVTYGRTAIILASAAKITQAKYYGIDNFKMGSSAQEVQTTLSALNLPGKVIKGDTNTVKWNQPIDYLLFDAGHDELNMRQDTARWLPLLSPGGLVLFHAYNPDIDYSDPHFPVKHWADERTFGWEQITYIPNLLVMQKPV